MATVENIIEKTAQEIYEKAMQKIEDESGVPLQRLCELAKADVNGEIAPVIHAKWEMKPTFMGNISCCSECGNPAPETNYCPNCGAKMDLTGDNA